jgi:hypothetical protein
MGWEQRGNTRYYYRKRREGDCVVSEYVGTGEVAEAIAALDARDRDRRQLERQKQAALQALDAEVDEVCDLIRILTRGFLLATGYHTHKGQWRKTRHG